MRSVADISLKPAFVVEILEIQAGKMIASPRVKLRVRVANNPSTEGWFYVQDKFEPSITLHFESS